MRATTRSKTRFGLKIRKWKKPEISDRVHEVLRLDEPFGALDAKVRKDLRVWLRRLHDEMHVTTICVTHDQEEAMDVAEQLVVMNEGRVEQSGTADDLYDHPANEFVMSFVGEVNKLGDSYVRPHDMDVVLEAAERT